MEIDIADGDNFHFGRICYSVEMKMCRQDKID